ncbi:MAG: hypothetical protein KJ905_03345 [Nanoarchaeota archaeon]|nr:hypothetical protein [Nanoarchaeota archaeon]MBU1501780.1 hypothetical protein [Nanoarchaeota archaeon]
MEKFIEKITESERIIKTADHMIYMVFPMIKDKRILLKSLSEIKKAVVNCITIILQYEYVHKRINLHKNPQANFKTFVEKCATRYEITEDEIKAIIELFDLVEKHKKSSMEFIKDDKIIILSDRMKPETLTLERTKNFLEVSKNILRKTNNISQL